MSRFSLSEDELSAFKGRSIDLPESSIDGLVPTSTSKGSEMEELLRLSSYFEMLDGAGKEAGTNKWFVPGTPYGIEHCHKHRAFFEAGALYNERLFLAANRIGKSVSGAFE